ncbi:MAG TPA: SDR family oxidoreductase [Puia sp.]|jgi:decaprenylphospho-beta-D-erythro-pentofuranosid-2-ulose 2-reductase|nr:SDR family oxidoreductase [Puia sp.]
MATVLILGATSDIGVAIAKRFASEKFDLLLAARKPELLKPLESDIYIRYGASCSLLAFDALDFKSHTGFFNTLQPKPDVSICVFGILGEEDEAFDDWDLTKRMIDTNYTGAVSILNVIAKYYIAQKRGTIIGISSVAGDRGRASKLIYASAKAAFTTYLAGLRNKCFEYQVHVMTVQPGFVYTKMTENQELPKAITSTPGQVANIIYNAYLKKKNIIYIKWFWRYIMLIIQCIPEFQFKKMKL